MGWDFSKRNDMIEAAFILLCASQASGVPEDEYKDGHGRWMKAYHEYWLPKMIKEEKSNVRN